jgi:hypothetical protein
MVLMRKRRCNMTMFDSIKNVTYYVMATPGTSNAINASHKIVEFMKAALNSFPTVISNVEITMSAHAPDMTGVLVEMWRTLDYAEIDLVVARAKGVPLKKRSDLELFIVSSHSDIVANKKKTERKAMLKNSMKQMANSPGTPLYKDFSTLKASKVWALNVHSGALVDFTAKEWLDEHCVTHSLVILGKPKHGKTPAARSLCVELAHILNADENEEGEGPYYIKVGTVDSLRKVQGDLRAGTPLLFDDITPSAKRGTRSAMTIEELKHITNVDGAESCEGRSNDITISDECPRIFTSNASTPTEWCVDLPDVRALPQSARLTACSDNALAIFKRVAFMQVYEPLISIAQGQAHVDSKKAAHTAKVARRNAQQ